MYIHIEHMIYFPIGLFSGTGNHLKHIFEMPHVMLMTTYQRVILLNVILNGCRCHFVWYWSVVPFSALCLYQQVGSNKPFPASACAWLHWLGMTTQVRGQFGVTIGSSVLPNKTAGPPDWIQPVSWQQAPPTAPPPQPYPEPWGHPSSWWLRLQGSILHSSASIHLFL